MMRVYRYAFQPGQTRSINAVGRFIRGLAAKERYQLQFDDGPATQFETGIAYKSNEPFQQVRITNTADIEQIIEVAIADGFVDDNRLVGRMDITGDLTTRPQIAASHTTHPVQSLADTLPSEVLPANDDRQQATVSISEACFIDDAANGVMIPAGRFTWDTKSALVLVASVAPCEVRILEEHS